MVKNKKTVGWLLAVVALLIMAFPGLILAQSSSPNYRLEESYFGTGGEVDASSTNYRARQSTGSLGVGNTAGTNNDATTGFNTPSEPFLEVVVTGATVSFGTLSDSTTSSAAAQAGDCNCSFYVRSYLSSGYNVITMSNPPTNESGDMLTAKSVLGPPSTNQDVEEFGINLVDNTSPNIGSNPVNEPDNTYADGKAATGYDDPDDFKYGVGDIIASSPATVGNQGVGRTNYTISYIAKIKPLTPAGFYQMRHDIVVVPTY
jgi:hypothetical protein